MKNCSQCNDTPELLQDKDGWLVKCPFCGFCTNTLKTQYDAVAAWDEIWDIIEMRADLLAMTLIDETEEVVNNALLHCSVNILHQYLELKLKAYTGWKELTTGLMKQIKVTELSYERLRKKIDTLRSNNMGS